MMELIIQAAYLMLPAYAANMAPVVFRSVLHKLAFPIDGGRKFRNRRILGDNKTYRGLVMGIISGIAVAFLQYYLDGFLFFQNLGVLNYSDWLLIGFLMGFGAIAGDSVESFFKRGVGIKPGSRWIILDQLDFPVGALLLLSLLEFPGFPLIITAIIASLFLTITANHLAFWAGIRKEAW
jgi:CDP-2,3-bis-(O-geranylgeranyl)-sn-glycerol synthase